MKEPTVKGSISPADWIKAIAAIAGLPLALYALVNAAVAAAPLVTLIVALTAAILASIYLAHFQRVETVIVVIA